MVDALGRALRLDADALTHRHELSQPSSPLPDHEHASRAPDTPRPGIAGLVDRWSDQPVIVIGRYRDVLAANSVATSLNPSFAVGRNLLWDAFLDPAAREKDVTHRSNGPKRYRHPAASCITLSYEALAVVGSPRRRCSCSAQRPGRPTTRPSGASPAWSDRHRHACRPLTGRGTPAAAVLRWLA